MKATIKSLQEENKQLKIELEKSNKDRAELEQKLECQFHLKTIEQRYKDLIKETELLRIIKDQAILIVRKPSGLLSA